MASAGASGSVPKLDVGLVMSSLGLMRGGMETQARHLAMGLVERGHCVTVVTGWEAGSDLKEVPCRSIRIPCVPATLSVWRPVARRRPGWPLKVQGLSFAAAGRVDPRVRKLVDSADVTLTFFEVETAAFSTWRERCGCPNVSYFPGGIDWKWLERDRSVVRVALSQTMAERYQDVPGFDIDGVILPGVADRWLEVPYVVRPAVRTLIFVGRLEANKGITELLGVFEALAPVFDDLTLRILGDGPLRGIVEARAARAGLADRVTCTGSVPMAQVERELRKADLFVFPSRYESLPMAVLEAQAVGVPVVGSDIPGIRDALGDAGRLVPLDDETLWTQMISALIRDRGERRRMSQAGRRHARDFSWRRAVVDLEHYLWLAVRRFRR